MSSVCRADTSKLAHSSVFSPPPVLCDATRDLRARMQPCPLPRSSPAMAGLHFKAQAALGCPLLPGKAFPGPQPQPRSLLRLLGSVVSDFSSPTRGLERHSSCWCRQSEAFVNYSYILPWKSCSVLARYLLDSQASQRLARTHKPRNMTSMPNMNEFTPDSAY